MHNWNINKEPVQIVVIQLDRINPIQIILIHVNLNLIKVNKDESEPKSNTNKLVQLNLHY